MKNKTAIIFIICLLSVRLVNGQNQWVSQVSGTSSFLTSVYFVTADTGYTCSQAGSLLKTVNGGTNWNQVGTGPEGALWFLNSQKGFGQGETDLLVTQNGGTTWTSCFSNPNATPPVGISFPNQTTGYGITWSTGLDNYVIKTNNGGLSWDTIYRYSYGATLFTAVFFTSPLKGYVTTDYGTILKTTNGGASWIPMSVDSANTVSIYSIYFPTPDTGFVATDIHGVYRTTDGGDTWNHLSFSFPPTLVTVFFTDANHGFVGGGDGFSSMTLYRTNDGGNSWTQSASGVQTLNSIFFIDSVPGYAVGTNGTILKYTSSTGIEDNAQTETFSVYPNPATNNITIELSISDNSTASVYNLEGQMLLEQNLLATKTEMDISSLSKGVYVIKLNTENGVAVRKFVKE